MAYGNYFQGSFMNYCNTGTVHTCTLSDKRFENIVPDFTFQTVAVRGDFFRIDSWDEKTSLRERSRRCLHARPTVP